VIESVTGPDGTLRLDVPLGLEKANQTVQVVIESLRKPMTPTEWSAWVLSMAGSITDPTFEGAAVVTYLLDTKTCIGWSRHGLTASLVATVPAVVVVAGGGDRRSGRGTR
jgi:hypothetical protein